MKFNLRKEMISKIKQLVQKIQQIGNRNCQEKLLIISYQNQQLYIKNQIQEMSKAQFGQFCETTLEQFLAKSSQIHCQVIGTIESITKHKKFIIEVFENKKSIIRSYKRFSQFEALYELIKTKFPIYEIQEFPSKFQIFGKEEKRKIYFQNLLNTIIKDYGLERENTAVSQNLVTILFNFLCDHILQEKNRREIVGKKKINNKENVGLSFETEAVSESGKKVLKKKIQSIFQPEAGIKIQRRASIDTYSPTVRISRTRSNSTQAISKLASTEPETPAAPTYSNEFQIKFANEQCWKLGYIEIKNSTLYLYKNKIDTHFKTCVELYRIRVEYLKRDPNLFDHLCERAELDLTRTFNQNQQILSLYHEYDHNKILIRKPLEENPDAALNKFSLESLKSKIMQASRKQPKSLQFQGTFNPIGKLFIFLHSLHLNWKRFAQKQNIYIRIKTGTLVHHSMPITYNNQCDINQGFMLPISNTFERIRIECYTGKDVKEQGNLIGVFKFSMVEFFVKPERSLVQKLEVKLENPHGENQEDYETKMQISLENLSDVASLYSNSFANQNDGFPLKQISGLDDIEGFSIAIDRILAIVGSVSLALQAFSRNALKFKYPILGYAFFSFVLINVAFVPMTYILRELMLLAFLGILYQQEHVNIIFSYLMNRYIFSYIHPDFKIPQVLSTNEATNLKWANQMKYIAEDYEYNDGNFEKKNKNKREAHYFEKHGKIFVVKEEEQSFFQKIKGVKNILQMFYTILNSFAFSLEKIVNLFCWVDSRRTALVALIVLIMTGLASGTTLQLIICGICAAKLIKGTAYYHHKIYQKNRQLCVHTLRYILQKHFPALISKPSLTQKMPYFQLSQYMSQLKFPIQDESSSKKLKQELSRLIGVHIEIEALYPKCTKQNHLKLVYLIDMIETCEDRLALKMAAGEEGVSDQFQQLVEKTRDVEDIDDWLLDAAKNFVLNIPSRMFLIFHRKQLNKIEKAENQQNEDKPVAEETQPSFIKEQTPQKQLKQEKDKEMHQIQEMNKKDQNILNAELAKQKMIVFKQVSLQ